VRVAGTVAAAATALAAVGAQVEPVSLPVLPGLDATALTASSARPVRGRP
jgi:hypothetical protein